MQASVVLTLLLGAGLLATGVVRIVVGLPACSGSPRARPLILAGVVTALLGLLIVVGWPANSLFVLGTLARHRPAVLRASTWIVFGFRLRALAA